MFSENLTSPFKNIIYRKLCWNLPLSLKKVALKKERYIPLKRRGKGVKKWMTFNLSVVPVRGVIKGMIKMS